MMQTIEERNRESRPTQQPGGERRRPGRRDYDNPALIALLRENRHLDTSAWDDPGYDPVAVGIIFAVIIGVVALGAIVLVGLTT
jgi:hypothetical protein